MDHFQQLDLLRVVVALIFVVVVVVVVVSPKSLQILKLFSERLTVKVERGTLRRGTAVTVEESVLPALGGGQHGIQARFACSGRLAVGRLAASAGRLGLGAGVVPGSILTAIT